MSLPTIFSRFSAFGFSGSRSELPSFGAASRVVSLVPTSASVFIGCASGVDAYFRWRFPSASVFSASSFGSGRGVFAARSVAVVRAVAAAGGLLPSHTSDHMPSSPHHSVELPSNWPVRSAMLRKPSIELIIVNLLLRFIA